MKYIYSLLFMLMAEAVVAAQSVGIAFPSTRFGPFPYDANSSHQELLGPDFQSHLQQVYDASQFLKIAPQGGWIVQFSFRLDAGYNGGAIDREVSGIQILMGTTKTSVDSLSPVFSDNLGQDAQMVRKYTDSNPVHIIATGRMQVGDGMPLSVPNPFFYDPRKGNLIIDIQTKNPTLGPSLDYQTTGDGSMSSVWGFGFGGSSAPDKGDLSPGGFVSSFVLTLIPEPNVMGLVVFAGAALIGITKKNSQR